MNGFYAVSVSGNWRVTFRFVDGNAYDVNLVDRKGLEPATSRRGFNPSG